MFVKNFIEEMERWRNGSLRVVLVRLDWSFLVWKKFEIRFVFVKWKQKKIGENEEDTDSFSITTLNKLFVFLLLKKRESFKLIILRLTMRNTIQNRLIYNNRLTSRLILSLSNPISYK